MGKKSIYSLINRGQSPSKQLLKYLGVCPLFFSILFFSTQFAYSANKLTFTTYISSPDGEYDRVWLKPRTLPEDVLPTPEICDDVTLLINSVDKEMYFCDVNGSKILGAIWKEVPPSVAPVSGKNGQVHLLSYEDRELKVGIGTTTPYMKLTIKNGGILGWGTSTFLTLPALANGKGRKFIWHSSKAAVWAGQTDFGTWNDSYIGTESVTFGLNQTNQLQQSVILGGESNSIFKAVSQPTPELGNTIAGGFNNVLTFKDAGEGTNYNTIAGGKFNVSKQNFNFLGGGFTNRIEGSNQTILAGQFNQIEDPGSEFSTIGGGNNNYLRGKNAVILGGYRHNNDPNTGTPPTTGNNNTVLGGSLSMTDGGTYQTIGSGHSIFAKNTHVTILGGWRNQLIKGTQSTIASGYDNSVGETDGVIISGLKNAINDDAGSANGAVIAGGNNNQIHEKRSVILNGIDNYNKGDYSSILTGQRNYIFSAASLIVGGIGNCTGSMAGNVCVDSAIPAGIEDNIIVGSQNAIIESNQSFVGGQNMRIVGTAIFPVNRTFLWGHSALPFPNPLPAPITTSTSHAFIVMSKVVGLGVLNPVVGEGKLQVNGFVNASDFVVLTQAPTAIAGNPIEADRTNPAHNKVGCIGPCDLAETYETSEEVEVGDLVVIDDKNPLKLKKSSNAYDKKVVGIVSGSPAIVFEDSQLIVSPKPFEFAKGTKPPVALAGRVPCKVSLENGPIEEGDLLTSSSVPGHVMKATDFNKGYASIIGKALQPFNGGADAKNTGVIMMMVTR